MLRTHRRCSVKIILTAMRQWHQATVVSLVTTWKTNAATPNAASTVATKYKQMTETKIVRKEAVEEDQVLTGDMADALSILAKYKQAKAKTDTSAPENTVKIKAETLDALVPPHTLARVLHAALKKSECHLGGLSQMTSELIAEISQSVLPMEKLCIQNHEYNEEQSRHRRSEEQSRHRRNEEDGRATIQETSGLVPAANGEAEKRGSDSCNETGRVGNSPCATVLGEQTPGGLARLQPAWYLLMLGRKVNQLYTSLAFIQWAAAMRSSALDSLGQHMHVLTRLWLGNCT